MPSRVVRRVGRSDLRERSLGLAAESEVVRAPNGSAQDAASSSARASRNTIRRDPRADDAGRGRVGRRHAALHGAGAVPEARQRTLQSGYVIIGEGTHSIIMEKNRMQLFREVQLFLDAVW